MSRAPFVMPKAETAFSRATAIYDTTIGWRFVNKVMKQHYGIDSMPETAENVAREFRIERAAQDRMALASQKKTLAAQQSGFFNAEIVPVLISQKKGETLVFAKDEHPRESSLEALAKLKGVVQPDGSVTAGNASGVNDGACALLLANESAQCAPFDIAAGISTRSSSKLTACTITFGGQWITRARCWKVLSPGRATKGGFEIPQKIASSAWSARDDRD
jgi:acetyl-CoA acetyltransferase